MDKSARIALAVRRIEMWNAGASWASIAELTDYAGPWRSLRGATGKAAKRLGLPLRSGVVRAWTDEERATVTRMVEEGATAREIGKAIGRTRDGVLAWVHLHGLSLSHAHMWRTSEARRAANMYRSGMTCSEIGARMGHTARSVYARLVKDGVNMRKRGGANRCQDWATRYMLAREGWRFREIVWLLGLDCDPESFGSGLRLYIKRSGLPPLKYSRKPLEADRMRALTERWLQLRTDLRAMDRKTL
jgi:DNA-binding CsgD family transcriptional regulator